MKSLKTKIKPKKHIKLSTIRMDSHKKSIISKNAKKNTKGKENRKLRRKHGNKEKAKENKNIVKFHILFLLTTSNKFYLF